MRTKAKTMHAGSALTDPEVHLFELTEAMREAAREHITQQSRLGGALEMLRAPTPEAQAALVTAMQSAAAEASAAFLTAHDALMAEVSASNQRNGLRVVKS